MTPRDEQNLEHLIDRTLRALPPRSAPPSLEARVLAEIARRAALPWWRQSFAHWPLAARAVFIVVCAGLAKLTIFATVWAMGDFDAGNFRNAFAAQFGWLETALAMARIVGDFVNVVARNIPPLWLYGALGIVATLYVAFVGLSAAAYRTLYASR